MPVRRIHELIESALATLPSGPLLVACSGGLDSSVLLHVLASAPAARARGLRAVHVDHGLQDDSAEWARHCQRFADALRVPLSVCKVEVVRQPGLGLEASARQARYAAIESLLVPDEIVALAHHRDDQVETVLLKLLRGAGPEGIGAMRPLRRLGIGFAWRPLLGLPRAALREYADEFQLTWLQDPSNADPGIDRNYLRLNVLPRIARRWPEVEASIAQSATWARAAAELIDLEADRALARLQGLDPATLRYRDWLDLPTALRDPVLRRWLRALDLPEPTHYQAAELVRQLAEAGEDRQPCVRWPGVEVRRYRELLYALTPLQFPTFDWHADFDGTPLTLPCGLGQLRLIDDASRTVRVPRHLQVRFRRGGESLRLARGGHTRELRDLFQEAGIPPWQRGRLPLLFDADGVLLAVADMWLGGAGARLLEPFGARLEWATGTHAAADEPAPAAALARVAGLS
ncbi:MAG: tRNA lysidine(34) synthetase TilS [Rhodanobacteraceae bacterium]|jgi:tRNA(Ile)-lysidine synthase|nr:tRNA lysidine(34) synthetase TilS [Rhodanobacteraceae bacterium]